MLILRLIVFVSIFLCLLTFANEDDKKKVEKGEIDYSVDLHLQSYPGNGFLNGDVGYALPFWQASNYENLYGYVRPNVQYSTSFLVNSFYAEFELFPIPFLGFYGGIGGTKSYQNEYQGINCKNNSCNGTYTERYLGAKGGISYSSFFLTFDYYSERLKHSNKNQNFVDHRTGLILKSEDDTLTRIEWAIGLTSYEKYSCGILNIISKTNKLKQNSDALYLMFGREWDHYTGTFLVGNHHSNDRKNHLSIALNLNWIGKRGLGFF